MLNLKTHTAAPPVACYWAVIRLDTRWFALPVATVLRVAPRVAVTPLIDASPAFEGVVQFAGRSLAVMDLRHRLGLPPMPARLTDRLVILQGSLGRVAFHVSYVAGLVVLDAQRAIGSHGQGLTAAALASELIAAEDGTVLELDPASLWSDEREQIWSQDRSGGRGEPQRHGS